MNTMMQAKSVNEPILGMRRISKSFPGVKALDAVDFELLPGEVHVLLGENGAGKSTLMKVLTGIHPADSGEIVLAGRPVDIRSINQAQRLGISIVLQELNLIPQLSIAENIVLIGKPGGRLFEPLSFKKMNDKTRSALDLLDIDLDPETEVAKLSIAQKQMVEIAKALSLDARIIVMDEPTAALTESEVEILFELIRSLKAQGISIVYISHRFEEIFAIGDRVTVLRDGKYVATHSISEVSKDDLIKDMVGRELDDFYPKKEIARGPVLLEAKQVCSADRVKDVSFKLHAGEILGMSGLMGAGRTDLGKCIFGAHSMDRGEILIEGRPVKIRKPGEAMKHGIALLTEDRKEEGLVLPMSLTHNITLTHLKRMLSRGFISFKKEKSRAREFIEKLRIVTSGPDRPVENLSGGNQQKVVVAKWLGIEPRILILDEPTRGIDVGAKVEIYEILGRFVEDGGAVIMISSELPEIIGMCDRVLVMHEGKVTGTLERSEFSQESILHLATGGGCTT